MGHRRAFKGAQKAKVEPGHRTGAKIVYKYNHRQHQKSIRRQMQMLFRSVAGGSTPSVPRPRVASPSGTSAVAGHHIQRCFYLPSSTEKSSAQWTMKTMCAD